VRRVGGQVGFGGRVLAGVDGEAVPLGVGDLDVVVERERRQFAQAPELAERVELHASPGGPRAVGEPGDDPPVFLGEAVGDALAGALPGPGAGELGVGEVLADAVEGNSVARAEDRPPGVVREAAAVAGRLPDGDDDAGVDLVLRADVGRVPRVRAVRGLGRGDGVDLLTHYAPIDSLRDIKFSN